MTEASLALQAAIRARLVATQAVTALVPANSIHEGRPRPEEFPAVQIGDGQTVLEAVTYARRHVRVYADLHVWCAEEGVSDGKAIAGAIRDAIMSSPLTVTDWRVVDHTVTAARFMRDTAGLYSHCVVSVEALMEGAV